MSKFAKMNKNHKRTVNPNIDTTDMEFKPLKDLANTRLHVQGFFFTEGDYGKQVVVVTDNELVNMPSRAFEEFDEIMSDDDLVASIVAGDMDIIVGDVIKTKKGKTVAYEYTDHE